MKDLILPDPLAEHYELVSCLKYSEQASTCLIAVRSSGKTVLLKTASDPLLSKSLLQEKMVLEMIHQTDSPFAASFPRPILLEWYGETCFYIRSYIEGKSLEELCESNYERPGFAEPTALEYLIELTEILHFMHTLTPSLLHRDIKPQNVIVDSFGKCHFIDLGISRFLNSSKTSDTLVMGTRLTAPPEQFGYQQTDLRSDIYSLGILLLYCITGEYKPENAVLMELSEPVRQIVTKATMFDPDKRYQTTEELLPDLLKARYPSVFSSQPIPIAVPPFRKHSRSRLPYFLLFLFTAGAGLAAGWRLSGKISLPETIFQKEDSYTFTEPLIEEAVRSMLNKPEGLLTLSDLEKVTELHIFGLQIFSSDSEFQSLGSSIWFYDEATRNAELYKQRGTISSLEDITHMPNLTVLSLYNQQISDISPLKDTTIKELGLGYNPLTDLTPLSGNSHIESLNLSTLEIEDLSSLAPLPALKNLDLGETKVSTIEPLLSDSLEKLNLFGTKLNDYTELRSLKNLTSLTLDSMTQSTAEALSGMNLTELEFHYSHDFPLSSLNGFSELTTLFFRGDNTSSLVIGSVDLPALMDLTLISWQIEDFSELERLSSLKTLHIYGADCLSYEGLDRLPSLKSINCTEEQKNAIMEAYPDNDFIFLV